MPQNQSLPRPSDKWIPYYFFAFFFVLVLVLVPMCIIALRTNSGVVTDNAYEKGLTYNKSIQANKQQQSLQWHGHIDITTSTSNDIYINFTLTDAMQTPLDKADVRVWLVRPTQSGMDQQAIMMHQNEGHYFSQIHLPQNGLWEARISATLDGQNYQLTRRVQL